MQYVREYLYSRLFVVYLKFSSNWASCYFIWQLNRRPLQKSLPIPFQIPKHLLEMGVGWCWLLGLFTLLGGAAALYRGPGL